MIELLEEKFFFQIIQRNAQVLAEKRDNCAKLDPIEHLKGTYKKYQTFIA